MNGLYFFNKQTTLKIIIIFSLLLSPLFSLKLFANPCHHQQNSGTQTSKKPHCHQITTMQDQTQKDSCTADSDCCINCQHCHQTLFNIYLPIQPLHLHHAVFYTSFYQTIPETVAFSLFRPPKFRNI